MPAMHVEMKHEETVGCSAEPAMLSVSAARSERAAGATSTPTRPSTQTVATSFTPSPGIRVAMASPSVHCDPVHELSKATPDSLRATGTAVAGSPSVSQSRTLFATYTTRRTVSAQRSGTEQGTPSPAIAPPLSPSHPHTTREPLSTQRENVQPSSRRTCTTTQSTTGAPRPRTTGNAAGGRTKSVSAAQSQALSVSPTTRKATQASRERGSRAKDEERRRSQREKQASYGYVTEGYKNMVRLIEHDPLLKSGGVIPLSPPELSMGSKRTWDIQLRKWRRALHMFDYVYIDGIDPPAQRAIAMEAQRRQWVSEDYEELPKEARVRHSLRSLRAIRDSPLVPTRIPVEDGLRCILRSAECYESVRNVVPQSASSLTKGTDISPLEAGIKIHIAPSAGVLRRQQEQQEQHQQLQEMLLRQQQQQQQQQGEVSVSPARERTSRSNLTTVLKTRTEASQRVSSPSPKRPTSCGRSAAACEGGSATETHRLPSASRTRATRRTESVKSIGEGRQRGRSQTQQEPPEQEEDVQQQRSPAQRLTYGSAARSGTWASHRPHVTSQPLSHAAMPFYGPTAPPPQQLTSRITSTTANASPTAMGGNGVAMMPTAPHIPPPQSGIPPCPHQHCMPDYDPTRTTPAMQPPASMIWPTSMPYYHPVMCPYTAAPALVPPPAAMQPCACCGYAPMVPMMMMVPPYATMMSPHGAAPPNLPHMANVAPHYCPAAPMSNVNTMMMMSGGGPMASPPGLESRGAMSRYAPHYVSPMQPPAPSHLPPPLSVEQLQSGTTVPNRGPASAPANISHYQRRHAPTTPQKGSAMRHELSVQRTPQALTPTTQATVAVTPHRAAAPPPPTSATRHSQQPPQAQRRRSLCSTPPVQDTPAAAIHGEEESARTVAAPHVRRAADAQQAEEHVVALDIEEGSAETATPARALLSEASVDIATTARVVEPCTETNPDDESRKEAEEVLGKAVVVQTTSAHIEHDEADNTRAQA